MFFVAMIKKPNDYESYKKYYKAIFEILKEIPFFKLP